MGYDKLHFDNNNPPALNSINLNHMETGIAKLYDGTALYFVSTNIGNAYAISSNPTMFAYESYTLGMTVRVKFNATNTGASTINLDGLGNINLKKITYLFKESIESSDITTDNIYTLIFDGTDCIINIKDGWRKISETTISSPVSQINLTIPSGYKRLELVVDDIYGSISSASLLIGCNNDSANNYYYGSRSFSSSGTQLVMNGNAAGISNTTPSALIMQIDNQVDKNKCFSWGFANNGSSGAGSGLWLNNSSEISTINILANSGNISSCRVTLRGLR